ncbi:eukaryotic integral membrane protein-domain-containing protein [Coniochaeta sp. 2T2.1]|nr:eukaryotic integral membrane protein-domain-containing protein [Coniochaeta sp. 2T2.1]
MPPRINLPPVTRILLIALTLQSVLSAAIRYRQWSADSEIVIPYLNLIPQLSLIYPWTFLTTTLVESNVFTYGIAASTIYYGGRYLERAWSSRELGKFLLVVSLVPNALTFATLILFFSFTRNEHWTLTTVAGTIPLQISFLVAFSQLVPAHTVTLFRGILSLRVPRFPLLHIGLVTLLAISPLLSAASFFLAIYGFLTSWTYLRFFKTVFPDLDSSNQPASLRGDSSETFAFHEFFPGPVKPFVAALGSAVFDALVAVRICTPFAEGGYQQQQSQQHLRVPGGARAEAERRRALALKALDQRLHAATASRGGQASSTPPAAAPVSSQSATPAPTTTGPTVQTQPTPVTQTAMMSQPAGGMLGETSYNPDSDKGSA